MYCENCGKKLNDNETCTCQSQVDEETKVINEIKTDVKNVGNTGDKDVKITGKFNLQKLVPVLAGALVLVLAIIFIATRPEKIKLDEYLVEDLEIIGFDGYASFSTYDIFDNNAFMDAVCDNTSENDYSDDMSDAELEDALFDFGEELNAYDEVESSIVVSIYVNGDLVETPEKLKNGDEIEIKVSSEIETSDVLKKKFISGSKKYKIEGLEKGKVYSPFDEEYFSYTITGADGYAELTYNLSEESPLYEYIHISAYSGSLKKLSNGDEIELSVSYDEQELLDNKIALSEDTYTIEISGLGTYVNTLEQIPDEIVKELRTIADSSVNDNPQGLKYKNAAFKHSYFLYLDNENHYGNPNQIVFVYTCTQGFFNTDGYVSVIFPNIIEKDGELTFNGYKYDEEGAGVTSVHGALSWGLESNAFQNNYYIEMIEE